MTTFLHSPRLRKGGTVWFYARPAVVQRNCERQYNPDALARSLHAKSAGMESGDHSEALRLKRLPVEPVELKAQIPAREGRNP